MALKNKGRELTVNTALGDEPDPEKDDPLVLAQVSGAEGISMPYAFNLTMVGTKDAEIEAKQIVGFRARFGIRSTREVNGERETEMIQRFGVLETFERIGTVNGRRVFRGRLVPAFRMTAFEQRYRVFEERTLVEILRQVLDDFPMIDLRHNLVSEVKQQVIPFAVQFNETTFAFIHRLLDRLGIAYRFEHDTDLMRERMVLSDTVHRPGPVGDAMRVMGDHREHFDAIAGFRRSFTATAQHVRLGDFNILNPADPPEGLGIIDPGYAMGAESIGIRVEAFPAAGVKAEDPDAAARLRMKKNEALVVSASGRTGHTGFFAGRQMPIGKDETKSGFEGQSWVLKLVTIEAFDLVDDRSGGGKFWDFLKSALGIGSGREDDLLGRTAEELRDRLKEDVNKGKEVVSWLANTAGASNPSGLPGFIADKIGRIGSGVIGGASLLISAIPSIVETIQKAFKDSHGFACAFEAIPVDDPFKPDRWPTPVAARPVAAGPHLALVIGNKGIETTEGDILTDGLGRVRIRFPWDRGPPGATPDTPAEPPLATGLSACWVRVSEGWAGDRIGMQFLPRIGQEVVVGFLDGDPERPMIVGRAYNADSGQTNLPYPPPSLAGQGLNDLEQVKQTANSITTRSGIRTRSMPSNGAADAGFHMIRLEDEKGKEQFLLRAERRMDFTTTGSRYDTTRGSQHMRVGGGKPPPGEDSGGGLFISVGGEEDRTVGDVRYGKVKDDHLTVEGDLLADVGKRIMMVAGDSATLSAGKILIAASQEIRLMVGSSVITISPSGIVSQGAIIKDSAPGGAQPAPAPDIGEPLGAAEADPGEPADWLATRPKGKGGGRKTKTMFIKRGPDVQRRPDGKLTSRGVTIDPGPDGDTAFADAVAQDLDKLSRDPDRKPDSRNGREVTVRKSPPGTVSNPMGGPTDPAGATLAGEPTGRTNPDGTPEMGTGKGSDEVIQYDPARLGEEKSADALGSALSDSHDDHWGRNPANGFGPDRAPDGTR